MKRKYVIYIGVIIIILGYIYGQTHILITSFIIPKKELTNIIILTKENNYEVTDTNIVLNLSVEISKMKKVGKINSSNYPLSKEHPSKFIGIVVQTQNKGNIGGTFWVVGNEVVIDSNGYYWIATKELFALMEKSIKDAKKLN